jgi:hypothetical protein
LVHNHPPYDSAYADLHEGYDEFLRPKVKR